MGKLKFILVGSLASLLFIGCTSNQPAFDPSNKDIKMVEGKPYRVPHGASYSHYAVSNKVIEFYQDIGLSDCQKGDITWEEQKTADAINTVIRKGSKSEGKAIYRKAATEGKIGCSSPLSDKEYQSYLKQ